MWHRLVELADCGEDARRAGCAGLLALAVRT
jgi:hypothetical protein